MADVRGRAPLRVDLRKGKEARRVPRVPRLSWPVMIVVALALLAVRIGIGRISPGAGVGFELAIRWVVAAGWMVGVVLIWRHRDMPRMSLPWLVFVALGMAWFLGRAGYETYIALT